MNKLNHGHIYQDRISAADAGARLLDFYTRHYPHSTAAEWWERIRAGQVLRNGVAVDPETRMQNGDKLEWHRPPWREPEAPNDFQVIRTEDSFLVANKPAGLPVLPGANFLENTLLFRVREFYGNACSPMHRLGRWTSGSVMFARTHHAAKTLGAALQAGRFVKIYLARVAGTNLAEAFVVRVPIGSVAYAPLGTLHAASETGRAAESHVEVIYRSEQRDESLAKVTILTGRPHQIRIHLAACGHPLAGDPLYGPGGLPKKGGALPGDPGYSLHAWKLRFPHPDTGARTEVECPPPAWAREFK